MTLIIAYTLHSELNYIIRRWAVALRRRLHLTRAMYMSMQRKLVRQLSLRSLYAHNEKMRTQDECYSSTSNKNANIE